MTYSLVPIREEDMLSIMEWRNAQIDILRQKEKLTPQMQKKYFQEILKPSFQHPQPRQILFSFLKGDQLIGYGGLTHIDWNAARGEISFLLETERTKNLETYNKDFSIFLGLLKKVAFKDFQLNRIFAETFDIRPYHVEILVQNGFVYEGRLREHVRLGERYVDSLIHSCLRSDAHALE